MKNSIVLVTGGTGGHFFCMQAVAHELNNIHKKNIVIITDKRCTRFIDNNDNFKYVIIPSLKKRKNIFANVVLVILLLFYTLKFLFIFVFNRPKMIVGFGGYASFCPLLSCLLLKIPIFLHEQNMILGVVNKIFARYAQSISLSLDLENRSKNIYLDKITLVQPPVRNNLQNITNTLTKNEKCESIFNIFIIGGSLGASSLSNIIPEALKYLKKLNINLNKISITQQSRKEDIHKTSTALAELGLHYFCIKPFFTNIRDYYCNADLVISRSGSSAITEIIILHKPCILVPLKNSSNNHQEENAKYCSKNYLCWTVEENQNNTSKSIANIIHKAIINPDTLNRIKYQLSKYNNTMQKQRIKLSDHLVQKLHKL